MPKKKLYTTGEIVYSTNPRFNSEQIAEQDITPGMHEQLLTVRVDARQRGGKTVTLIEGFTGTPADLEELAKQLKSYCGTGGSVKNNQIIIQGDNREKIFMWLNKTGYKKAKKL
jgi:translation initiation factor 1